MIPKWVPIGTIVAVLAAGWLEVLVGDQYFNYHTHDKFHNGEVGVLGLLTIALVGVCVIIGTWRTES